MKKLLLILLCLPLFFSSCKKEDEESPFTGHWEGTIVTGTSISNWQGSISSNGSFSGSLEIFTDTLIDVSGTVKNNGIVDFSTSIVEFMGVDLFVSFNGELSRSYGTGSWNSYLDDVQSSQGTWELDKQ